MRDNSEKSVANCHLDKNDKQLDFKSFAKFTTR